MAIHFDQEGTLIRDPWRVAKKTWAKEADPYLYSIAGVVQKRCRRCHGHYVGNRGDRDYCGLCVGVTPVAPLQHSVTITAAPAVPEQAPEKPVEATGWEAFEEMGPGR